MVISTKFSGWYKVLLFFVQNIYWLVIFQTTSQHALCFSTMPYCAHMSIFYRQPNQPLHNQKYFFFRTILLYPLFNIPCCGPLQPSVRDKQCCPPPPILVIITPTILLNHHNTYFYMQQHDACPHQMPCNEHHN